MSVYSRFKKAPDGLRNLVTLLETTPAVRRQKMIDVGMEEDRAYTEKALQYMFTFKDILALPDPELAEVIGEASPRLIGLAFYSSDEAFKGKVLNLSPPKLIGAIRESFEAPATPQEIGGAQSKFIEFARKLEKRGVLKTKRIPA